MNAASWTVGRSCVLRLVTFTAWLMIAGCAALDTAGSLTAGSALAPEDSDSNTVKAIKIGATGAASTLSIAATCFGMFVLAPYCAAAAATGALTAALTVDTFHDKSKSESVAGEYIVPAPNYNLGEDFSRLSYESLTGLKDHHGWAEQYGASMEDAWSLVPPALEAMNFVIKRVDMSKGYIVADNKDVASYTVAVALFIEPYEFRGYKSQIKIVCSSYRIQREIFEKIGNTLNESN